VPIFGGSEHLGDLLECFWRGFWACSGGMPRGGFLDSWLFEGADHFGFFPVFSWFLEVRKLDLTLENLSESSIWTLEIDGF